MGAALHAGVAACLVPNESIEDENGAKVDQPMVKIAVPKADVTVERKVRVQAADEIHYGSAGFVPKGATGVVVGKFEGNRSPFLFVNWDAFPELGRVSVQAERVLPMLDDRPGTYVITHDAGVTKSLALSREVVAILPVGANVQIVEVVLCQEQRRWRGRLEEPVKGWISLLASNNGARWAEQPSAGGCTAAKLNGAPPTGMQQNCASTVYSSSRPCAVAPSEAGSFYNPAQAQTPRTRCDSFQYTGNGETYPTTSLHGSLQFPAGVTQNTQALETPPTFAALEHQALSAEPRGPAIALSKQPLNAGMEAVWKLSAKPGGPSTELLAVLQGIKQQCKVMADRITEQAGDIQGGGSPFSEEATHKEELPKKWMRA